MAKKKMVVEGLEIALYTKENKNYISLTDIARQSADEPRFTIRSWMRNNNTLAFLEEWECVHNPDFKRGESATFRLNATNNNFSASATAWIEATNAIGIQSKSGRYGGTFAHQEIALNFCYWLSPRFQVYLLKEFERLKTEEAKTLGLEWDVKRIMAKATYPLQTEAVREHLIPPKVKHTKNEGLFFASEADLLNLALFGITSKEWKKQHPTAKGNIRDQASHEQLLVLSVLQGLNAKLIEWGSDTEQRLELLNKAAIEWMQIILKGSSLKKLPDRKGKSPKKLK